MTELNPNTARTESQDFQGNFFQPRSDRPIVAAMPHVAQVILFLRRAMLATHDRRARSYIHRLIEVQKAVFDGLRLLNNALENGDRDIGSIAGEELAALAIEYSAEGCVELECDTGESAVRLGRVARQSASHAQRTRILHLPAPDRSHHG